MRSGNPVFQKALNQTSYVGYGQEVMTVQGATNKSFVLLGILLLCGAFAWSQPQTFVALTFPAAILGFILAMVTVFKKEWSPVTAPIYAAIEGVVLGGISLIFEKSYPGIVVQAVTLTCGVLFAMLFIYRTGVIQVTNKFRMGVCAATGGIALIYIVAWIMSLFGITPFFASSSMFSILFSFFVVGIAALNLVIDFDAIERFAESNLPQYMEWYSAFALMITLVWLYMEILRLLAKMQSRR